MAAPEASKSTAAAPTTIASPAPARHYCSEQVKEEAIDLYGEGIAVAAISRALEVNLGTVLRMD